MGYINHHQTLNLCPPGARRLNQSNKWIPNQERENSLFDTGKMSRSFLGPEIFFVPYLTLTSTFIPNLTLSSNPLANSVNWLLEKMFLPLEKKAAKQIWEGKNCGRGAAILKIRREFLIWHWENESFLSWPWNFLRSLFDTHFNFYP